MSGTMHERVLEWFASGDTGLSSKTIALWLTIRGVPAGWGPYTPADPSDLGRCLRLLARVPEFRERFSEMTHAGELWPTFVERWDEIEAVFIEECGGKLLAKGEGGGISCPRTYRLMQLVRADAYEAAGYDVKRAPDGTMRSATRNTTGAS